jgi:hypothetical protein
MINTNYISNIQILYQSSDYRSNRLLENACWNQQEIKNINTDAKVRAHWQSIKYDLFVVAILNN